MDPIRVELEVSPDLLELLDVSEERLGPILKKLVALELCREGEMSPGRAARLLNVPEDEVIDVLERRGIDYDMRVPEEMAEQVEEVWQKLQKEAP
jgi:predicted HTH domain antitoxin